MKRKTINKLINKWTYRLGLKWWQVRVDYYEKPNDIIRTFGNDNIDKTVVARSICDWRYATCTLQINLPILLEMNKRDAEFVIVHELCHALVNEMREEGIDHEERVVTGLTKAFLWTEADCKETK